MFVVSIKFVLSTLFLALACAAFFSMLHLLGTPNAPRAKLLRIVHRSAGGLAVVLYVILSVTCVAALGRQGAGPSPTMAVHLAFASIFIPMILMKVVIVEKYPELRNRLFGVGTVLFAVVFVMFLTSALDQVAGPGEPDAGAEARASVDLALGKDLFVVKCAKCHRLDKALSAQLTPHEWEETVERMRQKDTSWMSESEASKITRFLVSVGE
jgi:mono/diheme cytochrome c family protein